MNITRRPPQGLERQGRTRGYALFIPTRLGSSHDPAALKDKLVRKEEEAAIKAALLAEGGHTPESNTHAFYHVTSGPCRRHPACARMHDYGTTRARATAESSSIQINHRPVSPRVALGGWGVEGWEVGGGKRSDQRPDQKALNSTLR